MILWIIGGIVVVIALIFIVYYNRFVTLSNQIDNSLAQISVQLKKRSDLIPNLLASVKGFMTHEKKVIDSVSEARKALVSARGFENRLKAGNKLQEAIGSIFAIAENYPQLKANENFLQLQQEMSAIEDKIAYSRQYYNDGIMVYNVMLHKVPGVWFARLYGFEVQKYYRISDSDKAVPKISF